MAKAFASTGDMAEKVISFTEIGRDIYAFTAEGDPNTGIVIGDDSVMVVDAQATPKMAEQVIERIRTVTDKPIKYVVLSHYHAVRVLGASAYAAEQIIASDTCRAMIHERGQEDWDSEYARFPRLFQAADSIPGLTWPTMTFQTNRMTVYMGSRRVDLMHLGPRPHRRRHRRLGARRRRDVHRRHRGISFRLLLRRRPLHRLAGNPCRHRRLPNPKSIAPGRGDALVGERPGRRRPSFNTKPISSRSTYQAVAEGAAAKNGTLKDAMGCLPRGLRSEVRRLRHLRALLAVQRGAGL